MKLRVALRDDWLGVRARLADVAEVQLVDELPDADAVVCGRLTPEDTRGAERLRLVQATYAGAERIDVAALPPGCALCNVYGHEDAIGEWVLMSMLALRRHLLAYDRALRDDRWLRDLPLERELRGRTVGTLGFGHIGRRVAELARVFRMDVVAVTRSPSRDRGTGLRWLGRLGEHDRLFEEADFVVVSLPLTAETEGLVGVSELELLGRDGYLLNVARGPVVEERALYEALRDGIIAGAALDVWWRYPERREGPAPPSTFPFGELPNVVMTPHVSGRSAGTDRHRRQFIVEQLLRLADGRPLENVIAVGPRSYAAGR